ncbi:hypothetical protein ACPA9J_18895 [Pseudomonas aeruginosa]
MQAFSKQQLIDALNAQSSDLATLQSLVTGLLPVDSRQPWPGQRRCGLPARPRGGHRQFRQQSGNQADERLILHLAEIVREQP